MYQHVMRFNFTFSISELLPPWLDPYLSLIVNDGLDPHLVQLWCIYSLLCLELCDHVLILLVPIEHIANGNKRPLP